MAELGEREDAYVTAWGLEIDDRTVLVLAGERPAFMLCASPEQAHRHLSRLAPVRLIYPHPDDDTAAVRLHTATSPE